MNRIIDEGLEVAEQTQVFQADCQQKQILATRIYETSRFSYMMKLGQPEMTKNASNYLIYVVRDPRSVVFNRMEEFMKQLTTDTMDFKSVDQQIIIQKMQNFATETCFEMNENANFLKQITKYSQQNIVTTADFFKQHTKILRYEDLFYKTREVIDQTYIFINKELSFYEEMDRIRKIVEFNEKHKDEVLELWKEKFKFNMVAEIQKYCEKEVFDDFGYRFYESGFDYLKRVDL